MRNDKSKSVAVIYHCNYLSDIFIYDRDKFQRRLQRAVEDMVEDGFLNFILSIDEHSPFGASFIDALMAEKTHNHDIRLTLLIPREIEEGFTTSPAERLRHYTRYADEIMYVQKGADVETALDQSAAVILCCEPDSSIRQQVMNIVQNNSLPFININM